jgi:nitrous oxidase accessory protein NosD
VVFYGYEQASSHCVFENIRVKNYGSAANTLHGVFYVTGTLGAITNSVIRDVYASGLANFGLYIRDCQDTKIENVRLFGSPAYACALIEDDGIYLPKIGASEHVRVRDCHVHGFGGQGIHVGGSYVVVEANRVEDCAEWGIYVANGAVRCVVSKNSVEGCSTTDAFTEAVGIYVLGDDCRVSDNYTVVVNDSILAGSYVVGLVLSAARCLATGNNVNALGSGGATLCGILFGNESVGSCVAVGNHMNGKGFVDLAGGSFCDVTHGNRG